MITNLKQYKYRLIGICIIMLIIVIALWLGGGGPMMLTLIIFFLFVGSVLFMGWLGDKIYKEIYGD